MRSMADGDRALVVAVYIMILKCQRTGDYFVMPSDQQDAVNLFELPSLKDLENSYTYECIY